MLGNTLACLHWWNTATVGQLSSSWWAQLSILYVKMHLSGSRPINQPLQIGLDVLTYTMQSSAKCMVSEETHSPMSLTYSRNRSGPSTLWHMAPHLHLKSSNQFRLNNSASGRASLVPGSPQKWSPPKKIRNLDINAAVLLLKSLSSVHFMNDSGAELSGLKNCAKNYRTRNLDPCDNVRVGCSSACCFQTQIREPKRVRWSVWIYLQVDGEGNHGATSYWETCETLLIGFG